jgi:hypothetical protein
MHCNQGGKVTLVAEEPSSSGIVLTAKAATTLLYALSFAGNPTAHHLFQKEMKEEIQVMEERLLPLHSHLKGGTLHNIMMAELWENADQLVWKEKAKEITFDILRYACQIAVSMLADNLLVVSPTLLI